MPRIAKRNNVSSITAASNAERVKSQLARWSLGISPVFKAIKIISTTTNPANIPQLKSPLQCGFNPGHDKCHVRMTVVVRIKKATAPTAPVDNANNKK